MRILENPSGSGILYEENDLQNQLVSGICCGCMSLYAEFLSWANANNNMIAAGIELADSIIILSCQVTDLSVFNDLKIAKKCHREFPEAQIYISGCLARRFDIKLPAWCRRLENLVCNGQYIFDKSLVFRGCILFSCAYCFNMLFINSSLLSFSLKLEYGALKFEQVIQYVPTLTVLSLFCVALLSL